ncbi:MAG: aconitate hydratase, partial [Pseudonocardiaceae bacterium]
STVDLEKGPNISDLPDFDGLPDRLELTVALGVGDNVSTDEISPAGAAALPYRSNIPKLAEFTFRPVDEEYVARARELGYHAVVGGANYGQGSSREHAVICPRFLGLRVVLARSYARIHWQNLANFGVLALEFIDADDYDRIEQDDTLLIDQLRQTLADSNELTVTNTTREARYRVCHQLSPRQVEMVLAGGQIPLLARTGQNPGSVTKA